MNNHTLLALAALDAHQPAAADDRESQVADLLADLMYFCADQQLDFELLLQRARGYVSEGI